MNYIYHSYIKEKGQHRNKVFKEISGNQHSTAQLEHRSEDGMSYEAMASGHAASGGAMECFGSAG